MSQQQDPQAAAVVPRGDVRPQQLARVRAYLQRLARHVTKPSQGFKVTRRDGDAGEIYYQITGEEPEDVIQIAFVQSTRHDADFISAVLAQAPLFDALLADEGARGDVRSPEDLERLIVSLADDLRTDLRVNGYGDVPAGWFDVILRQHLTELAGGGARSRPPQPQQELHEAARRVFETFMRDEQQGYRSRDRQFAIEVLGPALNVADGRGRPPRAQNLEEHEDQSRVEPGATIRGTGSTADQPTGGVTAAERTEDEELAGQLRYARGLIRKAARSGASFVDINVATLAYLVENRRKLNDRVRWAEQRVAEAQAGAALPPPSDRGQE